MPPTPENLLLAPLATPWGHRHGPPDGSALSRYPGPLRGEITASWTPPASAQHCSGPIVTTDGRVAIALDDKVVFLDPGTLLPIGEVEIRDAELAAADGDTVLAAGSREALRIGPDRRYERIALEAPWKDRRVRRLYDLQDGRLLALGDSTVAVLGPGGVERHEALSGWLTMAIGTAVLAPDGRLFIANASQWSSDDDDRLTALHGHAVELTLPALERRWRAEESVVTRVTNTGARLRAVALPQGLLIAEVGAMLLSARGTPLLELSDRDLARPPLVVAGRDLYHAMGHPVAIGRTQLPEATGEFVPPPKAFFRFENGESVYDMVGAADGQLYASTSQRLVAFRTDGELLWEIPRLSPYQLACGNGCLYGLERPLKLTKIG